MAQRIKPLAVLGGGPAGLSVGYHAGKRQVPFMIYEKSNQWGGNCVTHEWREFRFDSGAHRVHGTDKDVVKEFFELMGGDLGSVIRPSHIYKENGRYIFPLEFKNIVRTMPLRQLAAGLKDMLFSLLLGSGEARNFEELAVSRYGNFFAKEFLLQYTEKLWGTPCAHLDTSIAGNRLAGMQCKEIFKWLALAKGHSSRTEGDFYYPTGGVGRLMDALARSCGFERFRLGAAVTRVFHKANRICAIELNGAEQVEVEQVVSTLPLNHFLDMFTPGLGLEDLKHAFIFRNVVLVALFLNKPQVTDVASLYFPGRDTPFTRVYEPRNRCPSMSPFGKSSLVAEIPCYDTDPVWSSGDDELVERVADSFYRFGWVKEADLLGYSVKRMSNAYPVLRSGYELAFAEATRALRQISNLRWTGRNALFSYSWVHDQFRRAGEVVRELYS